jgi:hypothetical protein
MHFFCQLLAAERPCNADVSSSSTIAMATFERVIKADRSNATS